MVRRGSLLIVCSMIVLLSPSVGGQDVSNQALTLAVALDDNNNGTLNDAEIVGAIQLWIQGQTVPGTSTVIDDVLIIELIQIWISGTSLGTEAPTSNDSIVIIDFSLENGRLRTTGRALNNATAGSLVTLTGYLPQDPMVIVGGAEMEVLWQEHNAISFFIPYLGDGIEETDIVVINEELVDIRHVIFSVLPPAEFPNSEQILGDFIAQLKALMESSATARSIIGEGVAALEAQLATWTSEEKRIAAAYIATSSLSQWIAQFDSQAASYPNRMGVESPQQTTPATKIDWAALLKMAQRIAKGNRVGPKLSFGSGSSTSNSFTVVELSEDSAVSSSCVAQRRNIFPSVPNFNPAQLRMEPVGDASSVDLQPALPFTKKLANPTNDDKDILLDLNVAPKPQGRTRIIAIKCTATDFGGLTGVGYLVLVINDDRPPVVNLNLPQKEVIVGQDFEFDWNADDTIISKLAAPDGIYRAWVSQKETVDSLIFEFTPGGMIFGNFLLIEPAAWEWKETKKLIVPGGRNLLFYPVQVSGKGKGTCLAEGVLHFLVRTSGGRLFSMSNEVTVKCVNARVTPPPEGIPQITDFSGPMMLNNGEKGNVILSFSDSLGDINEATTKVTAGTGVGSTQSFPLNTQGAETGNLTFPITCRNAGNAPVNEQIEFTLKDALGQSSNTITFTHVCKPSEPVTPAPSTPPVIQEISSPSMIIGDNQPHIVFVSFSDAEGDVRSVSGRVLKGPGEGSAQEFLLDLADQVTGTFTLTISCVNTGETEFEVVTELILIDAANNKSSPKNFTYICYPKM